MRISTIVLSSHRQVLLEQTLRSYAATVVGPFEVIVIDDAIENGSRQSLERRRTNFWGVEATVVNVRAPGGESVTLALEQVTGDLVHIASNDQVFLNGWSQHARDCFTAFPGLGQLSLRGFVPADRRALDPADRQSSNGKTIYRAHTNIGVCSVFPRHVFASGLRLHNLSENGSCFGDDARLAVDIKDLKLWSAWSDRSYVRCIRDPGSDADVEPLSRDGKTRLGMNGFAMRPPLTKSMIILDESVHLNGTRGNGTHEALQNGKIVECSPAQSHAFDFLYALVQMIKPQQAVQFGSPMQRASVAIGTALRDNGSGRLASRQTEPVEALRATAEVAAAGLLEWVEIATGQFSNDHPEGGYQFGLFEREVDLQEAEFQRIYEKLAHGATVVFCGAGDLRPGRPEAVRELMAQGRLVGTFLPAPCGIFVGTVQRSAPPLSLVNRTEQRRKAILVLGVHRSGTSALAHLLNVLGAQLPEEVLGARHGNPLGHWEPVGLMKINKEILAAMGRGWNDPRPIPSNWFRSKEAYGFHKRIAAEISSSYGDSPLILIKEPRICRLAPLYLEVLDSLGIEPVVILIVRHPGEVIRSIEERDHLDHRTIELLWLRSLLEAEESSRDCTRVWTSFDRLLEDWRAAMQSIADRLQINWPNDLAKVSAEAANVVRPRHRHHRFADDRVSLPLSSLTIRAWHAAQHGLEGDAEAARALFEEIRTPIRELDRLSYFQTESIQKDLTEANGRALDREQSRNEETLRDGSVFWRLTLPVRSLLKRCDRTRNAESESPLS